MGLLSRFNLPSPYSIMSVARNGTRNYLPLLAQTCVYIFNFTLNTPIVTGEIITQKKKRSRLCCLQLSEILWFYFIFFLFPQRLKCSPRVSIKDQGGEASNADPSKPTHVEITVRASESLTSLQNLGSRPKSPRVYCTHR